MQTLRWTFNLLGTPSGVVTRLRRNADWQDAAQTLILLSNGSFYPLLGSSSRGGLGIGPQLQANAAPGWAGDPGWDPYSGSVFFRINSAVYRLTGDDKVELVAGGAAEEGERDGLGDARLRNAQFVSSDGRGRAFCRVGQNASRVAALQLPSAWRVAPAEGAAASSAAAAAAAGGPAAGRVQVTTLPFEAPAGVRGMACISTDAGGDGASLVLATSTAVYRLPLNGGDPAGALELLAGSAAAAWARADGRGPGARFIDINGLAAYANGTVVLADMGGEGGDTTLVRRLSPDGDGWTVTTLTAPLEGSWYCRSILPNGYLALLSTRENRLLVLDLGLEAPPLALPVPDGSAATAGPPRRTLHADMGALLDAQPDGSADLILVVGDRRFHAHRAILSARSDYFKQRLAPERFADGAAAELGLPDADPAAFELLLRFIYTSSTDIPASLAPSVAELADRLLLPELCSDARAVVLSSVCAATVVGSLLWADRLGGSFSGVLSSLKSWYLEHQEEVHEAAPDSIERLSGESPKLMAQLHIEAVRSAKRRRTG